MKTIFTVTVIFLDNQALDYTRLRRSRLWGYFSSFEEAEKCVKENWTDIYENGYYNLALINEMPEGVAVSPKNQHWYDIVYNSNDSYTVTKLNQDPINTKNSNSRILIVW